MWSRTSLEPGREAPAPDARDARRHHRRPGAQDGEGRPGQDRERRRSSGGARRGEGQGVGTRFQRPPALHTTSDLASCARRRDCTAAGQASDAAGGGVRHPGGVRAKNRRVRRGRAHTQNQVVAPERVIAARASLSSAAELKRLRASTGLTQPKFAARIGASLSTYRRRPSDVRGHGGQNQAGNRAHSDR
jgi:hypothetical protein